MNISIKQTRFLMFVVSINSALVLFAYVLMTPKLDSWKEMLVFIVLLISSIILNRSLTKLLLPILIDSYSPRYSTKTKNQWWGVFLRLASGLVGLMFASMVLPITPTILLITTAFYLIIVSLGFVNDGKSFEKYHNKLNSND